MATRTAYPVRVEGRLEPHLSRWLWLVKWILAVPHYFALVFLWMAFALTSVIAFFSILFTGRYPRSIFAFNVGVLRWSWRVAYYAYGALGTDRYPPFTLDDDLDYPARLAVAYPEQLSRGLVLVKWWLLAIPHYLIVGLILGGTWAAGRWAWLGGGGVIGILVLVAALVLAFTGRYPQGMFDLILGLNRWVLRVAAYVGLMTDEYPPFRLDTGGADPDGTLTLPAPPPPPPSPGGDRPPLARGTGWTGGRIASLVVGCLMLCAALGSFVAGGLGVWVDRTQRDAAGYVSIADERLTTSTYAMTSESAEFFIEQSAVGVVRSALGTVRLRVTPGDATQPIFVGIALRSDVERYLGRVARDVITGMRGDVVYGRRGVAAPEGLPADQGFWAASSSGSGRQVVRWEVEPGSWTVVVMNQDGRAGIDVQAAVAATAPALPWVAWGLLGFAFVMVAAGTAMVVVPIRRAGS
jgi:hypothetical protein